MRVRTLIGELAQKGYRHARRHRKESHHCRKEKRFVGSELIHQYLRAAQRLLCRCWCFLVAVGSGTGCWLPYSAASERLVLEPILLRGDTLFFTKARSIPNPASDSYWLRKPGKSFLMEEGRGKSRSVEVLVGMDL